MWHLLLCRAKQNFGYYSLVEVAKKGAQERSFGLKVGLDPRLLETPETSS